MNLRQTLSAASIFATLFCVCMQPSAAQQEIKLTKSITMLPDRPSGIEMIFKSWHNVYAEFLDPDRFILTFLTGADRRRESGKYYEHVLAFASGEPVKFSIRENSGECSEEQTMVFRVPSRRGPRLVVGTAERTLQTPLSKGEDGDIPSKPDPTLQRIRIYVPKPSKEDLGKSPIWLDAIAETVTEKALCSDEDVRKAIRLFVSQHIAELASQK